MDDYRIPRRIFYSQLAHGTRPCGGQIKHYKDTLKASMKACGIPTAALQPHSLRLVDWCFTARQHKIAYGGYKLEMHGGLPAGKALRNSSPVESMN